MTRKVLKVLVGPSQDSLTPIEVNDDYSPVLIDSPHFTGQIAVRIQAHNGFSPANNPIPTSPYFTGKQRFFSIQVKGRFKKAVEGDNGKSLLTIMNLTVYFGAMVREL